MSSYQLRYIANIVIEAQSPLKVGSSIVDMLQDSPVQKDFNGLPMILGTSIAGVLRKEFTAAAASEIFGEEKGSRLIISNALLCDENMQVNEKLLNKKSDFLKMFDTLPQREHTAITDKGVATENSKFDEEVVYKGSRFKFRLEYLADESHDKEWDKIMKLINSDLFRLGGGTTKGFGNIKVVHELSTYDSFELTSKEYMQTSSSLNTTFSKKLTQEKKETHYTNYTLKLRPEDFFIFGSGFGDDEADSTPVYEQIVDYKNKKLSDKQILLPASSIKGAISHRVAFHYNKLQLEQQKEHTKVGEENDAVKAIFGHKKEKVDDVEQGSKGKVLFSDCFKEDKKETKSFDHVSIDRFTGGSKDGALFQEKTIAQKDEWEVEILLDKSIQGEALQAFEKTLNDITTGMLPLGGMTTKGHGVFVGKLYVDGVEYAK